MAERTEMDLTSSESRTPSLLVYKLCSYLVNSKDDSKVTPHYQFALRVLTSNFHAQENDEFQITEKIKRKLIRQNRERDAAILSELCRKLQSTDILKNRWSILYLLHNLMNSDRQNSTVSSSELFGQSFATFQQPSTPFPGILPAHTPANHGIGMPQQTPAHGFSYASKSSGIGSYLDQTNPSTRLDPSLLPSALSSSHLQTPFSRQSHSSTGSRVTFSVGRDNVLTSTPAGQIIDNRTRTLQKIKGNMSSDLPENSILRDVVYVLQGIDGNYIKFDMSREGYMIDQTVGISKATREVIKKLVECGWLYNKVKKYTDTRVMEKTFGLVGQSFCAALQQELTEYYRLIAVLDSQLQQELDQGVVGDCGGLTLKRLSVWTLDPLVRLKSLGAMVDVCKGKKGGALASTIHSYIQHGDPYICGLVKHTLTLVVQPIFATVTRWMYDGELDDAFHEFFVASDPSVKDDRLWHDKYSLRKSMIPSFVQMPQARRILNAGKSINFLRQLCQDRTTIKSRDVVKKAEVQDAETMFTQDLVPVFQNMVDTVYSETSSHLLHILHSKYKFMDHLKAMRRYLLLGQGDFIRHLMDLLQEDLEKPANTLYVHNLTGILETAIRATNAQFDDADILKRLDVRLLEVSPGDTGWDVFSLDYHVDGPISTVFTSESIITYLRVFNFLWRAKRMEYILAGIWKCQMSNSRWFQTLPEMRPVFHMCHVITSEMVHFIQQVQYYINFEVLECAWDELLRKVRDAKDLDHIIAAHQIFLDAIVNRSLLDDESRSILTQLRTIFDLIIQFQSIQEKMYQSAEEESAQRSSYISQQEKNTEDGEWGLRDQLEEMEKQRRLEFHQLVITTTRAQLRVLTQSYQDMIQQFLTMLNSHPDVSLRFLSFRLDFNEHYRSKQMMKSPRYPQIKKK